ncbi:MAG: DegT/DnrJ/EryC1/StrS family aminotransferase [Calditrichaeota bacterium]|nr:DegT/DnrJ/EryC1/StrS family aminotransferase [Calditrichota bacterium]
MNIPFHRSYTLQDDIDQVVDTLKSGWLTMGPKTIDFETRFAKEVKSQFAVSCSSGTAAMHLALKAIDLKAGDEVIIPDMTFTATGEVVRYFDAMPVLADIERDTFNIDVRQIEKHITPRTKAIIPVHMAGQSCDMDEIMEIAKNHNLKVIEDAAHCFPTYYKSKPVGAIGDITAFSFYATKTIACGEGGMATTQNEEYAKTMKMLRLHGISKDAWKRYSNEGSWFYEVVEAGYKYNMTDIQAGLGIAQLNKANDVWELRKKIAKMYNDAFATSECLDLPFIKTDRETSWHLYIIRLKTERLKISRNEFIEKLKNKGVNTSVHFIPLHYHPYYKENIPHNTADLKNSEWVFERNISLPIYPGMTVGEVEYVCNAVLDICRQNEK